MAVTATFKADFTSFYDAVNKAEISLKDLESGANKAESSLQKMATSFSGKKVIQDAQAATAAIGGIENVTKLTENEQARLNAMLTEALAKYAALGKQAPEDMIALANATKKVETSVTTLQPPLSLSAKAAGLLGSAFGTFTAAGLATNAVTSLASGLGEFAKEGLKLPGLQRSFETLASGIGASADDLLDTMQDATHGLVSNLDLMQTANKAVLLGLPVTVESMGDLATAATTLGRAMGQDATKSLDDLITALGRSSPMILDNLGLSVKVGEANEKYAASLGKTAEQLTDAEKKMAFYNAAMEAARKKTEELGDQTTTLSEIAGQAWTLVGNVVTSAAARINIEAGKSLDVFRMWREEADRLGIAFGNVKPPKVEAPNIGQGGTAGKDLRKPALDPKEEQAIVDTLNKQREAMDKTAKEAERLKGIQDQLFGRDLITAADNYTRALGSIGNLSKVSSVEQAKINKAIGEALDVYKRFGQVAPQAMRDLFIATAKMPDALAGIPSSVGQIGRQFDIVVPKIVDASQLLNYMAGIPFGVKVGQQVEFIAPKVKQATLDFSDLSKALSELATVSGGTFGGVTRDLSQLVAAANAANKGVKELAKGMSDLDDGNTTKGILETVAGISDIAAAAIAAGKAVASLFGKIFDRNKGRDLVVDFADTLGGFDALHEKLLMLGADGEALWVKLSQGVGRNNPQQAQQVIDEVTQALEDQAKQQDDTKDATEEQAQATIETATQAKVALDELGIRLDASKTEWGAWSDVVTGYLQKLADGIRALPVPSVAGGTGASLSFAAGSGMRGTTVVVPVSLDSHVVTEVVARNVMTN